MYYLITCDKDRSLCIVEDYEIVGDLEQPPILDEHVDFFYGTEKFTGTVVGISDQSPSSQRSGISRILQKKGESDSEDSEEGTSSASDNDNYDNKIFEESKKETIKKGDKKEDNQIGSKKEDDQTVNPQLWGKNCGEPVVMLKNHVYCKKTIFDNAEDSCRKSATSFLRRLMDGVFKPDVLLDLNCTYSGRSPSAQGKDKQLEKVVPLDRIAKKALIEYCHEYATQKGWSKSNPGDLGSTMSQWIGELKRGHRKNQERNE